MNERIYFLLIAILGGVCLVCVVGVVVLQAGGQEIPPALSGLGGTALGSLVGLLGNPPKATKVDDDGKR